MKKEKKEKPSKPEAEIVIESGPGEVAKLRNQIELLDKLVTGLAKIVERIDTRLQEHLTTGL